MKKHARLAIAVPMYNRARVVQDVLPRLLNESRDYQVNVYISDDSTDPDNEQFVQSLQTHYDNIYYRRNIPSLGHDNNIVETLLWPDEEHVWLMGDSFYLTPGTISGVINFLQDQDFTFVNYYKDNGDSFFVSSDDKGIALLREVIWHQTLTSATIYNCKVREWVRTYYSNQYKNFPQLGIILGYCASHRYEIGWYGLKALRAASKPSSYWANKSLDVFFRDWAKVVSSNTGAFGTLYLSDVLKSHSKNQSFFDKSRLMRLKKTGELSFNTFLEPFFWDVMHLPAWKVVAIVFSPTLVALISKIRQ